jgi:hypothetical protein
VKINTTEQSESDLRAAVLELAQRMDRVEKRLGLVTEETIVPEEAPEFEQSVAAPPEKEESLEFEVGQTWFALIGIVALAIGAAFLLSLPFADLPSWLPSVAGYVVSAIVLYLAKVSRRSFEVISKYLRGAGMLLLFFATLRLYYFGEVTAVSTGSLLGRALLLATVAINLTLAWRRGSTFLFVLAVLTGCVAALAVGTAWFVAATLIGFPACVLTYAVWAIGYPVFGHPVGVVGTDFPVVYVIPLWMSLFSYAVMRRPDLEAEDTPVQISGVLMCGLGLTVFLLHHLLGFDTRIVSSQLVMAVLLLGISLAYWIREKSKFSTFIYAMTGYMALSVALVSAFDSPEVFVALSLQSLVVIATAVYFCSPFIIVANSLIFIGIILGYMAVSEVEQGMSIGFGIVALVSARILNWQKKRLALQTELMRNTYLVIAFLVFPYALYYMVPEMFVAVAWTGLALFYYGLFLFFGNRKYRWMGHWMLLLTALYAIVIGTARLESHYRIITFLVLGSIMVIVSLVFSIIRSKRRKTRDRRMGE